MSLESPHEERKLLISECLAIIEDVFEVNRKKVFQTEFFVMAEGLHFSMNVDLKELHPHMQRLLNEDQDRTIQPDYGQCNQ